MQTVRISLHRFAVRHLAYDLAIRPYELPSHHFLAWPIGKGLHFIWRVVDIVVQVRIRQGEGLTSCLRVPNDQVCVGARHDATFRIQPILQ